MYYINLFFFFSIIGFVFECIVSFLSKQCFESGFLYGPWTPIYGLTIFLILGVNYFLKRKFLIKILEVILFFVIITIVITVLEFIGGHFIYLIFKEHFWDYSNLKFSIGKYICFEISLVWGILATFINYFVYPKIIKIVRNIPHKLTIVLIVVFTIDIIITLFTR